MTMVDDPDDLDDDPYRAAPSTPGTHPRHVTLELDKGDRIQALLPISLGTLVVTRRRTWYVSMAGDIYPTPLPTQLAADSSGTVFLDKRTLYVSDFLPGTPRPLVTDVRRLQEVYVSGPWVYWVDYIPWGDDDTGMLQEHRYVLTRAPRQGVVTEMISSSVLPLDNVQLSAAGISWTITSGSMVTCFQLAHGALLRKLRSIRQLRDPIVERISSLKLPTPWTWSRWIPMGGRAANCWVRRLGGWWIWGDPSIGVIKSTHIATGSTSILYSSRELVSLAVDARFFYVISKSPEMSDELVVQKLSPNQRAPTIVARFAISAQKIKALRTWQDREILVVDHGSAFFAMDDELFWCAI